MNKQPDKLDVLMDWFLGDAKEINEEQKNLSKKQEDLLEKLASTGSEIISGLKDNIAQSIQMLPDQLDGKIQQRFEAVSELADKLEFGAQQQAVALSNQVKVDAESVRKTVLEALQKDIGSATYQLNLAAIEANRSYNKPWWLIGGAGVLFLVASFISGVGGMMLYNAKTVELLEKEKLWYRTYIEADKLADLAVDKSQTDKQKSKNIDVYNRERGVKFTELLKNKGLTGFTPREVPQKPQTP